MPQLNFDAVMMARQAATSQETGSSVASFQGLKSRSQGNYARRVAMYTAGGFLVLLSHV